MKKESGYHLAFGAFLLLFVFFKWSQLSLPFFWDESWVYGPALQLMAKDGPGLLPNDLNDWYSRGHPLLFHFLGSSWIKLFGSSLPVIHGFALSVSVLYLVAVYWVAGRLFGWKAGIGAGLLVAVQPGFIAQSTMVMPEIFLAITTLAGFYFLMRKKYLLTAFAGSLAVLTKETGLAIFGSFMIYWFLITLKNRQDFILRKSLMEFLLLSIPFLVFAIFLTIQYLQKGWFLYPTHVGMIDLSLSSILHKLEIIYKTLFVSSGMIAILLFSISSAVDELIARKKISSELKDFLLPGALLLVLFSLFSAVNFFTYRYLLPLSAIVLIPCAAFITGSRRPDWMKLTIFILLMSFSLSYSILPQNHRIGDTSMGYVDGIRVNQECINWMVDNNLQKDKILTHFLMQIQLSNASSRYLEKENEIHDVVTAWQEGVQWVVYSNFEKSFNLDQVKQEHPLELIRRFESGKAYTEIYKVSITY